MMTGQTSLSVRQLLSIMAAEALVLWLFATPASWRVAQGEVHAPAVVDRTRLLESTAGVFGSVADLVSPAVVYIEAAAAPKKGLRKGESGSGVLLRPASIGRPVVVTNLHVVQDVEPASIEIQLSDGRVLTPSRVLTDSDTDLAVLDVTGRYLPAARVGDSESVRVGQWVLAIGSPFGLSQSVSHGIISAKNRASVGIPGHVRIKRFLQTDAAINPGSSGGPLVNLNGEVIGINTAIASRTGGSCGVGFSIPINIVSRVVQQLLEHGKVRRAFLGVQFPDNFSYEEAIRLGLPSPRGALVSAVRPDSPADKAGFKQGDVILAFDGVPVVNDDHLISLVGLADAGESVAMQVWRDGDRVQLSAVLGSWDDDGEL